MARTRRAARPGAAERTSAGSAAIDSLPAWSWRVFGAVAVAALAHTLVTLTRRRRRDLAILKTLGFTRGQVLAAVAWQATIVAGIGLLVGLPLGVALGRWAWTLFAEDLGVVPEPVTPLWPVLLVVPATLLLANLDRRSAGSHRRQDAAGSGAEGRVRWLSPASRTRSS